MPSFPHPHPTLTKTFMLTQSASSTALFENSMTWEFIFSSTGFRATVATHLVTVSIFWPNHSPLIPLFPPFLVLWFPPHSDWQFPSSKPATRPGSLNYGGKTPTQSPRLHSLSLNLIVSPLPLSSTTSNFAPFEPSDVSTVYFSEYPQTTSFYTGANSQSHLTAPSVHAHLTRPSTGSCTVPSMTPSVTWLSPDSTR